MAQLSLLLMGLFQATIDQQPLAGFQSYKVQALLAYLAAESDLPHPRETLAGLLWPDYPNPSALTYLRNALANLRQVIGDPQAETPFLVVTRAAIWLNPAAAVTVDLRKFEELTSAPKEDSPGFIQRLESALALYRGPFLEGLACDSSAFEEWALARRERLSHRLREALGQLSGAYARSGDLDRSIQTARRLIELEPWDENAHRLVMRGLARGGQRSAALSQYETCRRILRAELDVEPDAETRALLEQIRSGAIEIELPMYPARSHLPNPLTSFIGRQAELAEICRLIHTTRLLTLTGTGGCGKTRLAIAAAHSLAEEGCFAHGVWWVDLSSITDPDLVLPTVAASLSLIEANQASLQQVLEAFLRDRALVLVLDNCEHLVDNAARLAERLLETSPGLRILATSRKPLGVNGEITYYVPPLALPPRDDTTGIEHYEAVRLFLERAQEHQPGFALVEGEAPALVSICRRLDGIPLGIELAAAHIRMLTIAQIAARLNDIFHPLVRESRTALTRQRTLHACIDWSYYLLSPAEQAFLCRLSVFNGGWTLEAVESICADIPTTGSSSAADFVAANESELRPGATRANILSLLEKLIDNSLVVVSRAGDQTVRYGLLEIIRQYAREKLVEAGLEDAARCRHMIYFRDLAVLAEKQLTGPDQVAWLGLLYAELSNLRAALEWSLSNDINSQLRIASALWRFWIARDLKFEGYAWLDRGLTADEAASASSPGSDLDHNLLRGNALNAFCSLSVGTIFRFISDPNNSKEMDRTAIDRYEKRAKEAVAIFRKMGRAGLPGLALAHQQSFFSRPDPKRKEAQGEEILAIARQTGDAFILAEKLSDIGRRLTGVGNYERAKKLLEEALSLRMKIGDLGGMAWEKYCLGELAYWQSEFILAEKLFEEALKVYQEARHTQLAFWTISMLACTALAQDNYARALGYSEQVLSIARDNGWEKMVSLALFHKSRALMHTNLADAWKNARDALLIMKGTHDQEAFACLLGRMFAPLAYKMGQPERATRLLSATLHTWHTHKSMFDVYSSVPCANWEITYLENLRATLRSALGKQAFTTTWKQGQAMTLEQAVDFALEESG